VDESCTEVQIGEEFPVDAWVHLGELTPDDVSVELCIGRVDALGEILEADGTLMQPEGPVAKGSITYRAGAIKGHRAACTATRCEYFFNTLTWLHHSCQGSSCGVGERLVGCQSSSRRFSQMI
jgi:hypothetical protein